MQFGANILLHKIIQKYFWVRSCEFLNRVSSHWQIASKIRFSNGDPRSENFKAKYT